MNMTRSDHNVLSSQQQSPAYYNEADRDGADLSGPNLTWANLNKADVGSVYFAENVNPAPEETHKELMEIIQSWFELF